jgi:V8-like Glu-specific endopeptidase
MTIRRWRPLLLAVLTTLLTMVAVATATATASPKAKASSKAEPALTEAAQLAGQKEVGGGARPTLQQTLGAYWTPQRMEAAIPADEASALRQARSAHKQDAAQDLREARNASRRGSQPRPKGPVGLVEPTAAEEDSPAVAKARGTATARASAIPSSFPYWSLPARTAGKVFFTNTTTGRNHVCSGTIVNSEGKNSVWTAGHCVHGGAGRNWHANWAFVPSYDTGWAPYGVWSPRELWTTPEWVNSSDFASDMAVAVMNPRNGWRIVDYLGGQGITWNQSKRIFVTAFGYPADPPFNGAKLWTCSGTTFPEWEFLWWSAETLGLTCDMTGGSSGGGWLAFFNGTTGYLDGNNSYKYDNDPNTMYTPYYDNTASALYGNTRFR